MIDRGFLKRWRFLPAEPAAPHPWGLILLILLVGSVLRFLLLPHTSVWLDEAVSLLLAPGPITNAAQTSPAHFFLLKGWVSLFGAGETGATVLHLLFSCATPLVIYFLAHGLFRDPKVALLAMGLAVLNLNSLTHASNIRYYAPLEFLAALSYLGFFRLFEDRRWAALYVPASLLAFYMHYYFVLALAAQGAITYFFFRPYLTRFLTCSFFIVLLSLPGLYRLFEVFLNVSNEGYNENPAFTPWQSAMFFLKSITIKYMTWGVFHKPTQILTLGLILVVAILLGRSRKQHGKLQGANRALALLALGYLVSVGVPAVYSIKTPVVILGRYDTISIVLVVLVVGYLLSRIRSASVILAVNLVLLAGSFNYIRYLNSGLNADQETAFKVSPMIDANDVVIYTGLSNYTQEYYFDQLDVEYLKAYIYPPDLADQDGAFINMSRYERREEQMQQAAKSIVRDIQNQQPDQIFLYHSQNTGHNLFARHMKTLLDRHYELQKTIPVRQHQWGPFFDQVLVYHLNSNS